jgi:capsular exopolysaccharide synthesis family protein
MTVAVLSGPDAGKVLRSARPRIVVGRADDNDLVVRDVDVAAHHFVITVDGQGWRAEPVTAATPIVMDNRWAHPETGRRGALVYATGTELLVYPGDLEQHVIDAELRARKTGESLVPSGASSHHERTRVLPPVPTRRPRDALPPTVDDVAPTVTLAERGSAPRGAPRIVPLDPRQVAPIDPLAMSSMPTMGDAPLPDVLTGRAKLPSVVPQIVPDGRERSSAWDRAPRARAVAPEILAEPESKMAPMPGSGRSVVAAVDDDEAWSGSRAPRVVEPSAGDAWGGRVSEARVDRVAEARTAQPLAPDEAPRSSWPSAPTSTPASSGASSAWSPRGSAARAGGTPTPRVSEPSGPGGEARSTAGDAWSGSSGGPRAGDAWSGSGGGARGTAAPRSGDPRASGATSRSGDAWSSAARVEARPGLEPRSERSGASGPTASSGAWGGRGGARPSAPAPEIPASRALTTYSGRELSMMQLSERAGDPGLSVLREPDGELATSIRVFVTRLLDLQRTYGYRVYMITSPEPRTGKTTVALNLALALAEDPKRRIALIEANFRAPRVAEVLGLPPDVGLLGLLEGRHGVAEATIKLSDRNLLVLPAGGTHPSPAEALASPRFKALIQELASSVDIALVDAPAVRASADANLLLPLVDGAVLVVRERETRGSWVDQALEQLGNERVLGAVYNRLDHRTLRQRSGA